MNLERNDPTIKPGDPYKFQRGRNPFLAYLEGGRDPKPDGGIMPPWQQAGIDWADHERRFLAGTTSIQAADAAGWVFR